MSNIFSFQLLEWCGPTTIIWKNILKILISTRGIKYKDELLNLFHLRWKTNAGYFSTYSFIVEWSRSCLQPIANIGFNIIVKPFILQAFVDRTWKSLGDRSGLWGRCLVFSSQVARIFVWSGLLHRNELCLEINNYNDLASWEQCLGFLVQALSPFSTPCCLFCFGGGIVHPGNIVGDVIQKRVFFSPEN